MIPKTAVFISPTRESLLAICEQLHVNLATLPRNGKEFTENTYLHYIRYITGKDPCPICNGPQRVNRNRVTSSNPGGVFCINHPVHSTVWYRKGVLDEGTIILHLGGVCEHNLFVVDCPKCLENKYQNAVKASEERRNTFENTMEEKCL